MIPEVLQWDDTKGLAMGRYQRSSKVFLYWPFERLRLEVMMKINHYQRLSISFIYLNLEIYLFILPDETSTPHVAMISYLASLVELLVKLLLSEKMPQLFSLIITVNNSQYAGESCQRRVSPFTVINMFNICQTTLAKIHCLNSSCNINHNYWTDTPYTV